MKNNSMFTKFEQLERVLFFLHYILFVLCSVGVILTSIIIGLELYYAISEFFTEQIISLVIGVSFLITFFTFPRFKILRKKYILPFGRKRCDK